MAFSYYFFQLWEWFVTHGIPLVALTLVAILIPRVGRLAVRIVASRGRGGAEAKKAQLALVGALVYVLQAVAYFVVVMVALTNMGVPAMSAALPATVVSAAVGFGAQKVIQDFLAGFFIISERQFGVGDYVSFDGTSGDIEGTVVALTLRATRIRTPSGEVVTIPNGSAGVITNFSQDWSRAVVDLAIPLQSGESMDDLLERVNHTANEAIQDPSIRNDVTGEVEILPATKLVAPTAAGQSWQVNFRTMVVVNPARQWAVERVIRSALLNVFWDRYDLPAAFAQADFGDAPTSSSSSTSAKGAQESAGSGAFREQNGSKGQTRSSVGSQTSAQESAQESAQKSAQDGTGARKGASSAGAPDPKPAENEAPVDSAADKDDGPGSPSDLTVPFDATDTTRTATQATSRSNRGGVAAGSAAGIAAAGAAGAAGATGTAAASSDTAQASGTPETRNAAEAAASSHSTDSSQNHTAAFSDFDGASPDDRGSEDKSEDDDLDSIWRRDKYDSAVKNALSLGGRIRPSTTGLVLGLLLTGGLALASSNPEGASAGFLSPDHWRDSKPAATQPAKPTGASNTPEQPAQQAPTATPSTDTGGSRQSATQRPETASPTTAQQQPQQGEPTQQQPAQQGEPSQEQGPARQPNAAGRESGGVAPSDGAEPSAGTTQTS